MAITNYPDCVKGLVYRIAYKDSPTSYGEDKLGANMVRAKACKYPELGFNIVKYNSMRSNFLVFLTQQDAEDFIAKYLSNKVTRLIISRDSSRYYRIDNGQSSIPCYAEWVSFSTACNAIDDALKKSNKQKPGNIEAGYTTYWYDYVKNSNFVPNPFESIDAGLSKASDKKALKRESNLKVLKAWSAVLNFGNSSAPYEIKIDYPFYKGKVIASIYEANNEEVKIDGPWDNRFTIYIEDPELSEYLKDLDDAGAGIKDVSNGKFKTRFNTSYRHNDEYVCAIEIPVKPLRTSPADTQDRVANKINSCIKDNMEISKELQDTLESLMMQDERIGLDFDED